MNETLKEFETKFVYDDQDLELLGIGSGIHLKKDVALNFSFVERKANEISDGEQIRKSRFIEYITYDILDSKGNIVKENYISGTSTFIRIPEQENELIFGEYQKDFAVLAKVKDSTTNIINSGIAYVYGNNMQISGVEATTTRGTYNFDYSIGVYVDVVFSNYSISGEMFKDGIEYKDQKRYISSGYRDNHLWEASLKWSPSEEEIKATPSYENYSAEISNVDTIGKWVLIFNDHNPSGSFLIGEGPQDFNDPFGLYIDPIGSGFIKNYPVDLQPQESGNINSEDEGISFNITYKNKNTYTEKSHINMYRYVGDKYKVDQYQFLKAIQPEEMENINLFKNDNLVKNKKTWYRFDAYSQMGEVNSWEVGPIIFDAKFGSTETQAASVQKKGNILEKIENDSGVLDRLFVDKYNYGRSTSIYEGYSGLKYDYDTILTDENGTWLNTSFDYTINLKNKENTYESKTFKLNINATGSSSDPMNIGMPLFKLDKTLDPGGVDFELLYSESGVTLLCNSGHSYTEYKYRRSEL